MRLIGPIFVLIGLTLISGVVYILYVDAIPYHSNGDLSSPLGMFHVIISLFLLYNIVWNYGMVIFTPPGSPPKVERPEFQNEVAPRKGEGFARFCKVCQTVKPPRTHHCHICKACILRFDHHCPWVASCVGFYNHRYFYLFLLYLWFGTLYSSLMTWAPFVASSHNRQTNSISKAGTLFAFVISLSVLIAISIMLGWHTYLILTNQTTVEFYYNQTRSKTVTANGEKYHNVYDLGKLKNFQVFFGTQRFWFEWLLPSSRLPLGDGTSFLTRSEHLQLQGINHHNV